MGYLMQLYRISKFTMFQRSYDFLKLEFFLQLSGKQAPTLNGLAEYLRTYPDYIISSDWSSVLRKSVSSV